MLRLLVTANVVPSSPILVTVMMEAIRSSEPSVLTRTTQRNLPEDGIRHSHCRENLKSYISYVSPESTVFIFNLRTRTHYFYADNDFLYNDKCPPTWGGGCLLVVSPSGAVAVSRRQFHRTFGRSLCATRIAFITNAFVTCDHVIGVFN
jgi:hypothetical protein